MLLKLYAGIAYRPFMAFVNMPLVFTSPNSEYLAIAVTVSLPSLLNLFILRFSSKPIFDLLLQFHFLSAHPVEPSAISGSSLFRNALYRYGIRCPGSNGTASKFLPSVVRRHRAIGTDCDCQSEIRSKSCCCCTSTLILIYRSAPWNSQYGTERNQFARAVDNQCSIYGGQGSQYINTNVTDTAIPKLLEEQVFWPKHQVPNNRLCEPRNAFLAETPFLVLNSGRSR